MIYPPNTGRKAVDGTLVLVLGILSLVTCPLIGPIAWVLGGKALADIRDGYGDPSQKGMVTAGYWCGRISTVLMVTVVLAAILVPLALTVWASH